MFKAPVASRMVAVCCRLAALEIHRPTFRLPTASRTGKPGFQQGTPNPATTCLRSLPDELFCNHFVLTSASAVSRRRQDLVPPPEQFGQPVGRFGPGPWLTSASAAAVPEAGAEPEAGRADPDVGRSRAAGQRSARRPALGRGECASAFAGPRRPVGLAHAAGHDSRTGVHLRQPADDWCASKNQAEISRLFDAPYNHPTPTKIPGGRLEIVLDPAQQVERFELNLATAEGRACCRTGGQLRRLLQRRGTRRAAAHRRPGAQGNPAPRLRQRSRRQHRSRQPRGGEAGLPAGPAGQRGRVQWFVQDTAGPLKYCVCVASRRTRRCARCWP